MPRPSRRRSAPGRPDVSKGSQVKTGLCEGPGMGPGVVVWFPLLSQTLLQQSRTRRTRFHGSFDLARGRLCVCMPLLELPRYVRCSASACMRALRRPILWVVGAHRRPGRGRTVNGAATQAQAARRPPWQSTRGRSAGDGRAEREGAQSRRGPTVACSHFMMSALPGAVRRGLTLHRSGSLL